MEIEATLAPFRFVQTDPYLWARQMKTARQTKVMGFLFPDIPEEMLHAFGLLPVAMPGTVNTVKYAYLYLPNFSCPFNVSPLEVALQGTLDFLDGLIIPYSCDAMRAFSHVWEANFPNHLSHTLWLPKKIDGVGSRAFFRQELLRMKEALIDFTGVCISDEDLFDSIKLFNRNRSLLKSLHQQQSASPPALSNEDFMSVVSAATHMPKETHIDRLEKLLVALSERQLEKSAARPELIRIFLFGSVCEVNEIYQCFDRAGIMVVDDSLYNGTRYFSENVEEHGDPLENLVSRHFRKDPISCYNYRKGHFAEYLKGKFARSSIDGVLYLNPKNCEVLQLDYPMVKGLCEEMDVPILFIEMDHTFGSMGQLEIRLEAFAEMIRERKVGGI
jgi:benzoyl-CoA reductase subunit C